jgi:hypothetical protein
VDPTTSLRLRWALAAAPFLAVPLTAANAYKADEVDGRDQRSQPTRRPTVEAAFARESYATGDLARLVVWTRGRRAAVQVFRAGTESVSIIPRDLMLGSPVSDLRDVGDIRNGDSIGRALAPGRAVSTTRDSQQQAERSGMRHSSFVRAASASTRSPSSSQR